MSVRCGNCKENHSSVTDVKRCFNVLSAEAAKGIAYKGNQSSAPTPTVKDGFYTVDFGDGERRTIRLRTQSKDDSFAPGEQIAAYLSGPYNESDYTQFAFVKPDGKVHVWRRFRDNVDSYITKALMVVLDDPSAPAELYAQESGNCFRCNRTLTVPESIDRGIGPKCLEVYGAA